MKWLVLLHVLSAIVGIGPTYALHILLRKNQSVPEIRNSYQAANLIQFFPKIFGTLAVLSGIALAIIGSYGAFTQLWLIGSLILYVLIQIIMVGFAGPLVVLIGKWLMDPVSQPLDVLPVEQVKLHNKILNYLNMASILGIILFIFMILKPA